MNYLLKLLPVNGVTKNALFYSNGNDPQAAMWTTRDRATVLNKTEADLIQAEEERRHPDYVIEQIEAGSDVSDEDKFNFILKNLKAGLLTIDEATQQVREHIFQQYAPIAHPGDEWKKS